MKQRKSINLHPFRAIGSASFYETGRQHNFERVIDLAEIQIEFPYFHFHANFQRRAMAARYPPVLWDCHAPLWAGSHGPGTHCSNS
jgi:hypothetical protein